MLQAIKSQTCLDRWELGEEEGQFLESAFEGPRGDSG